MTDPSKTYDVFISHAAGDAGLVAEIANAFRANGLDAITSAELLRGKNASEALREALAESRALVAILPPSGLTATMSIELGAAWGWNKPIFGIVTDPSSTRRLPGLAGIHLYTSGRIDAVRSFPRTTVPFWQVYTRKSGFRLINSRSIRVISATS